MNKRNIIIILCLVFSFISALAQSQSFYTDNHVVKVGETYYAAKEVSIKDKQIVITGDNGEITSIDVEHGKNMPVEVSADKGILCSVAGTLTEDLVNKAIASGHLYVCGSINVDDLSRHLDNLSTNVPVKFFNVNGKGITILIGDYLSIKNTTSIIFENCNFCDVTDLERLFYEYKNIQSFSFNGMGLKKIEILKETFSDCQNIKDIDFRGLDTSNVTNAEGLFKCCRSLESLDFSGCDLSKLTNTKDMFYGISSNLTIKIIGCNQETKKILTEVLDKSSINYEFIEE